MSKDQGGWSLDEGRAWGWALALTAAVTLVRLAILFVTPLELYPDEAQYWLWAQAPAWGYASKPPVIAWLIWLTTRLGDAEPWVRAAAPLLHGLTALALFRAARRLYGPAEALLSATLWLLTPAVMVSSVFIATDAPLMLFTALALWAYAAVLGHQQGAGPPDAKPGRARSLWPAAAMGAALGLAFLSKQAAIYFVLGLLIHALIDPGARRAWGGWRWAAALGAMLAVISPNLVWQATHQFATLTHTAQVNAGVGSAHPFHPLGAVQFLAAQMGVLGPLPFLLLAAGLAFGARRGGLIREDGMLLAFVLPPVLIMTAFAAFHEVEANWGAAGYPQAVVLVCAWVVRWRARGWAAAVVATQAALAVLLVVVLTYPALADAAGQSASLKRMRGWRQTAIFVTSTAAAHAPLTAIVAEDRSLFNELAYYGRDAFRRADAPPLRMRPPQGRALNQAELTSALQPAEGGRALIVEMTAPQPARLPSEFIEARPGAQATVRLDRKHVRELQAWLGLGYRGPLSARPGAG